MTQTYSVILQHKFLPNQIKFVMIADCEDRDDCVDHITKTEPEWQIEEIRQEIVMTDAQKIEALTELLGNVINTLELKQYEIENADEAYMCEVEADEYYQQMLDILHPKGN